MRDCLGLLKPESDQACRLPSQGLACNRTETGGVLILRDAGCPCNEMAITEPGRRN